MDAAIAKSNQEMYDNILRDLKDWHKMLKSYQIPDTKKAMFHTVVTFLLFLSVWVIQYLLFDQYIWASLLIGVFNGLALGRIFIIQHDCGHKSFTKSQKLNDIIGTICSFCTVIPYKYWAKSHDFHHAHNGQLETSDIGDVECLTTEQYAALDVKKKIRYRIYRNPFYLFTLGGFMYVTVFNRFAFLKTDYFEKVKNNVTINNILFLLVYVAMALILDWQKFFGVQLINLFFFGTYALWFFYIQHQYADIYKQSKENWSYLLSAIRGSTYYNIPKFFHWMTGNIGFHHIHHLCPSIPFYNLPKCSRENPIFQKYAISLSFTESIKCVYANLWDEEEQKMISFKEYKMKMKDKELSNQ